MRDNGKVGKVFRRKRLEGIDEDSKVVKLVKVKKGKRLVGD